MLPLIETIIGFCAIMLILSFLIKSLTSIIKNHIDFYSRNLRHEVFSLLAGTIDKSRKEVQKLLEEDSELHEKLPWLTYNWKRLGEEYLTQENINWVLKKLGETGKINVATDAVKHLEGRLAVHVANVRYMYEKRLKNITLAVGIALCLGLNINTFKLWGKLYNDQDVRAKFSSQEIVDYAIGLEELLDREIQYLPKDKEQEKEELERQRKAILKQIAHFQGQMSFGIGRIWTESPEKGKEVEFLFFEFIGSFLTGILVSIGAPYWHDLLRALTKLRQGKLGAKS